MVIMVFNITDRKVLISNI